MGYSPVGTASLDRVSIGRVADHDGKVDQADSLRVPLNSINGEVERRRNGVRSTRKAQRMGRHRRSAAGPAAEEPAAGAASRRRGTRRKKSAVPIRTGLLGVSAAVAVGAVAVASGLIPGGDTYTTGKTTAADQVRTGGAPDLLTQGGSSTAPADRSASRPAGVPNAPRRRRRHRPRRPRPRPRRRRRSRPPPPRRRSRRPPRPRSRRRRRPRRPRRRAPPRRARPRPRRRPPPPRRPARSRALPPPTPPHAARCCPW